MLVLLNYRQTVQRAGVSHTVHETTMVHASTSDFLLSAFAKVEKIPPRFKKQNNMEIYAYKMANLACKKGDPAPASPQLWQHVSQELISYLPACGTPHWR